MLNVIWNLPLPHRRALFFALVAATIVGVLSLATIALSPGGIGTVDLLTLLLFAVTLPWFVIGFWNATIGLIVMRFAPDPIAAVFPAAARVRGDEPVCASTAILVCIRNEMPNRVVRNLAPLLGGFVSAGVADRFHVYVLSDTNDPVIAAIEEERFHDLAAQWQDRIAVTYRRRATNAGFKAGNIRDFCQRWGAAHEFALTLDADSFMTADAILRLVRIMQADPKVGILQSLVVGLPSTSAFARLFQFGMRLGMRSYTIGSAWWQADCGSYWGHNAVLRLAPFIAHCQLPVLPQRGPLGGHILSHDQVEAALMRRAGYEVRVLPEEDHSWEENPATLLEFIRRDLRWCHGNMQYWRLLSLPGLKPISRCQLAFAILMFLGSPAWIGLLVTVTLAVAWAPSPIGVIRPDAGMALFILVLIIWFAPRIAAALDILARAGERRAFGGTARFLTSVACDAVFSILLTPVMWFSHAAFLAKLPFAKMLGWSGQTRDDHSVAVSIAVLELWPHTVLGSALLGALAFTHPAAIPYALVVAGGLALAVPLAVATALPPIGSALARVGLCRLPEETTTPVAMHALMLPATGAAAATPRPAAPAT